MLLPLALAVAAAPALLATGYLLLLTLASGRRPSPPRGPRRLRFDVVVPAHDEEAGIARTVASLRALDWPPDRFRVVVVADNCSDATAARAREAGAQVLMRDDPSRRGKGYALQHAFAAMLAADRADAAVVVDADTVASPDLLAAFAARLEAGADAIQARYGVLNPEGSWRTRLMTIAFATFVHLRPLGRERLGLSAGLSGNGMCFSARGLRRVPYEAFSVVEDLEYAIRLAEAGVRVHYAAEAEVRGEMVTGEAGSRSQRVRWEAGRAGMARAHGPRLLREALRRRDPVLLDRAAELLVPPLAAVALWVAAGLCAALALAPAGAAAAWAAPWLIAAGALAIHVLRGVQLSGLGPRGLLALAWAGPYVAWKLALRLGRVRPREWVRTAREPGAGPRR